MILILIRHGEAEAAGENGEAADRARNLTPAGREKAAAAARALRLLFPGPARILASPVPRAWQTAELLAGAFGAEAEPCAELEDPEAGALGRFLHGCGEGAPVVLAVGREPGLGRWLFRLTGKKRRFPKGGAAVVAPGSGGRGELILEAPPCALAKLGGEEFPFPLLRELCGLRGLLLAGDCGGETVHRLRVALRRAGTALDAARPLLPRKKRRKAREGIGLVFGRTNRARDCDVLLGTVAQSAGPGAALPRYLAGVKTPEAEGMLAAAADEAVALLPARLWALLAPPEGAEGKKKARRKALEDGFRALLRKTARRAGEAGLPGEDALHRLRICCKKICYTAELFPGLSRCCGDETLRQAKELKDLLGARRDRVVGRGLLTDAAKEGDAGAREEARRLFPLFGEVPGEREALEKAVRRFAKALRAQGRKTGTG